MALVQRLYGHLSERGMRDQIRLAVGPWGAEEEQAGRDLTVVGVCIRRKFVVLDSTAHDEVVARLGRDAARRSS